MSEQSSIMALLSKLMRHEQSARDIGSIAEAEAFAGKVQQLLTEHKLDMSEIQFEERELAEPIDEKMVSANDIGIKRRNKRVEWQEDLASAVASCNGCRLLVTQSSNTVFFVGRTSDRQVCVALYVRLVRMAFDLADKAAEADYDNQRDRCKAKNLTWYNGAIFSHWMRAYRKSFCVGFSSAIRSRLYEQKREAEERKRQSEGEQCAALVHIRKDDEAVQKYIEDKFKDRIESKAKPNIEEDDHNWNGDGYRSGMAAGEAASIGAYEISE